MLNHWQKWEMNILQKYFCLLKNYNKLVKKVIRVPDKI